MTEKNTSLTKADHALNAAQGILLGIPYVGATLSQFIFGPLAELRAKRIEATLTEVAEALGEIQAKQGMCNEQFANLLEKTTPDIARATDEEKRQRFRDLLINAGRLEPDSDKWSDATFAAELLRQIEPPGLAILAGVAKLARHQAIKPGLEITSRPTPRVSAPAVVSRPHEFEIPYDWTIVEEWSRRIRDMRLIDWSSHGNNMWGGVVLKSLGKFLVDWSTADAQDPSSASAPAASESAA